MTDHSALIERLEAAPDFGTYADQPYKPLCLIYNADAKAAAAALRDLTEWRDIATAPKDGTEFIGCNGRLSFRTKMQKYYKKWPHEEGGPTFWEGWSAEDCSSHFPWKPTHWLPLPSAPNQAKEAGE